MNRETINRYFENRCTEDEIKAIREWIDQHGEQWYDRYFGEHYEQENGIVSPEADEAMFRQVLRAVKPVQTRYVFLRRWVAAAACVLLLVGGAWFVLQQGKKDAGHAGVQVAWVAVSNTDKTAKEIVLPDSSRVYLNTGSTLRYQQGFTQEERAVELSGEAFFEVTHDRERPFMVKAGDASTLVYGTAFNVQAYPTEGHVAISLKRGKIGIRNKDAAAPGEKILAPGQLWLYNKGIRQPEIISIPPGQVGGWMNGSLSFYNTPVKDVFIQLERKFGVRFSYTAGIQTENTFTAFFPNASLEQVLSHLAFTGELQFKRQDNIIYVK
ncbi:FecR family protein [Chitinophaga barathri]|uniref:FecR family protein n=1 Tax=Chitinophaga barathri TaxID=1647451 RepID=A0A3N4M9G5_9BACT|nr:FecR family protein [Chitinophaga barathri]RPD39965.1 FecR family protein [Chitinophaga barathri]